MSSLYVIRRCLSGNREGWQLPGLGAVRTPRGGRQGLAARAHPPQPGAGQATGQLGQPQPWASGTSLGMGTEHQPAGGPSLTRPVGRAAVGLKTASYGLAGAGTDAPGGWNGVLGHGQGGGSPRGVKGH